MPAYQYFYEDHLTLNETICLKDAENQHLYKVMRASAGDEIQLVNGLGSLAKGQVVSSHNKKSEIKIIDVEQKALQYKLVVLQALPQFSHLETLVEKGTELGLTELILFPAQRSSRPLSDQKWSRLKAKALAALKQSGRLFLPKLSWIDSLEHFKSDQSTLFFGSLNPKSLYAYPYFQKLGLQKNYTFACGPEGGFTNAEEETLKTLGFKGIYLHSNILRTETAPLAFLSLAHHYILSQEHSSIVN